MSADNTIVVFSYLKDRREAGDGYFSYCEPYRVWCVFHAQAWENYDFIVKEQPYNIGHWLSHYIANAPHFENADLADEHAHFVVDGIEDDGGYVEYGITHVDTDYILMAGR